jgi:hypothetical protein
MAEPWFDDYADDDDEIQVDEYEITATPNDFKCLYIVQFCRVWSCTDSWIPAQLRLGLIVHDDGFFEDFKLKLSNKLPNQKNN